MSKAVIEAFLAQMKEQHRDEIDAVALPEGTRDYIEERVDQRDTETLLFMLRLGYLMGLQTGFAAAQAGQDEPSPSETPGPIQA